MRTLKIPTSGRIVALALTSSLPAIAAGGAGSHPADREALVWKIPASSGGGQTWTDAGKSHPAQALPDGSRLVLLPRVAAGVTPTVVWSRERSGTTAAAGGPRWRKDPSSLVAVVNGHELFAFHFGTIQPPRPDVDRIYARSGFIDGIRTRAGAVVSEAFPRLPEKHEHQYAMWSAWTATEFENRTMNFWDVRGGTTQIRCEGIAAVWDGPVAAGFTAVNVFYDRTVSPEKPALRETWKVAAYHLPAEFDYNLFDVSLHQACVSASPVTIKKNSYGGFAMHCPDSLYGAGTLFMVSNGETDRAKANQAALRWIYMGGMFNGRQAGLAILAHPTNFRAPEPVRLHPQTAYFCFSPASTGEFKITPGQPYAAHYRVVVLDGAPGRDRLERLWQAFASVPPIALQ